MNGIQNKSYQSGANKTRNTPGQSYSLEKISPISLLEETHISKIFLHNFQKYFSRIVTKIPATRGIFQLKFEVAQN